MFTTLQIIILLVFVIAILIVCYLILGTKKQRTDFQYRVTYKYRSGEMKSITYNHDELFILVGSLRDKSILWTDITYVSVVQPIKPLTL